MKTISRQSARDKAVANVLATLRIEQLTPSTEVVNGLQDCFAGKSSTKTLLAKVMRRHVAVRRV